MAKATTTTNETTGIDPFDFNNLSDMPEDLQAKMTTETNSFAQDYADVVLAGAKAGHGELNINQIIVAAKRMGLEVPTQQTVRNYLNKAVQMGLIAKPTRQSYGSPDAVENTETPDEADPLAGV